MLGSLWCRLFGHSVDKSRVWFDDLNFRTSCVCCRRPLLRDDKGWRLFDSDRDLPTGGPPRKPHPHHHVWPCGWLRGVGPSPCRSCKGTICPTRRWTCATRAHLVWILLQPASPAIQGE